MNVVLRQIKGFVFSYVRDADRGIINEKDPEDGYWELVWEPVQEGAEPVTGVLKKAEAESIAQALNSLSREKAVELVKALHTKGVQMQVEYARKNQRYSGRSFEWPRT